MIKKLRVKFICVIMAIVMVLLGSILSVVIYFTGQNMRLQSISMMRTVADTSFQLRVPGKPKDNEIRLPYFAVQITKRGDIIAANSGYFDLTDQEYLQEVINAALESKQETGELQGHNLRYLKTSSTRGFTLVFADTTAENTTLRYLIYSCVAIFFITMAIFLSVSILLSHWVIKPVAIAWDQQRQFVADASHELKTPLSVIMASAELMQSADATDENMKKHADNILGVTYQMRSLVENMLEMARVDNGTVKMEFTQVDLSQLVSDAVLSFQLLYEEKGMQLHCAIPGGIVLSGSEQHLYQLMDILLDNALKYSVADGEVGVVLSFSGRNCVLSVASPGDPLSPEELNNIFKRFYRADKARAMNGSYGLGLSIAQSIVEAHKGKIWAESDNGYNTFYVQIPINN